MPRSKASFRRRSAAIALLLTSAVPLLSGCKTLHAESRVDPQTIAVYPTGIAPSAMRRSKGKLSPADSLDAARCPAKLDGDSHGGAIDLDCFRFPPDRTGDTAYQQALGSATARNRLAAILMKQSDDVCTLELGRLTANEAAVNTALSVSTSAFAGAASLVSGDTAQRILSGLAAVTSASRDHINAEIYRNTLAPVVAHAIEGERAKREQAIVLNLGRSNDAYLVDQMIRDVNAYHHVCSFYYGLGLVVKAVDRVAFEQGDRGRSISMSLDGIALRLEAINRSLAVKGLSAADKAPLVTQRNALIELQTKLIAEQAGLGAQAAAVPAAVAPAPVVAPAAAPAPAPAPKGAAMAATPAAK